jgi:hypothetical protein
MTKPARKLPPKTTAAITGFMSSVRDRVLGDRIDEIEKRFSGEIRGLQAKCRLLADENGELKELVAALIGGGRTHGDRRAALAERVADCGRSGDAG